MNDDDRNRYGGSEFPEATESVWRLFVSPTIWASHFLACYVSAAVWCAKYADESGSLGTAGYLIAGYTFAALAGIAFDGGSAYLRHRKIAEATPHDADRPSSRSAFLAFATTLLASLSAVATIFTAVAAVLAGSCD